MEATYRYNARIKTNKTNTPKEKKVLDALGSGEETFDAETDLNSAVKKKYSLLKLHSYYRARKSPVYISSLLLLGRYS